MDNKLIASVVGILVVIVLVGSLMVPAIDTFAPSSKTVNVAALKNIDNTVLFDDSDVASVVTSGDTTWLLTTDGKLFGYGKNTYGQQGDGTTTDVTSFTQRLAGETIASVSVGGGSTTWAVTTDGKLFGCGRNDNGQQGDGTTTNVTSFTQRLAGETIASVFNGGTTTWAVTTDGKLYGCGQNNNGQQGDGTTTDVTSFTQRLAGETIASVSAVGGSITWAVTTDGKLYGCGSNTRGQQGDGTTTNVTSFTQRLAGETISTISSSGSTTWALTTDGKLYGCGYNNAGQQGDGTTTDVTSFTQRLAGENIRGVVCYTSITYVIADDTKTVPVDSPYKIMLSVVPVIIIATVLVTMAAIVFRNRE